MSFYKCSGIDTSDATAKSSDILKDKTAYVDREKITGNIESKEATTYTPGTSNQTISSGQYLNGDQTIKGDSNLVANNIKKNSSIFGVSGTFTSDATATSSNILSGKTGYVNGSKVTGNISSKSAAIYTPGTSNQTISSGQYLSGNQTIKGDSNLVASNIKQGVSIFGITGTYKPLAIDVSNVSVGDTINISHSIYGTIPFIVIGKNHDANNSVTLLTKEILRLLCFDAQEGSSSDYYIKNYGNNRYKYSNLLQWMNSDKAAGNWYTAQHSTDHAPTSGYLSNNPYNNIDGLLRGFSTNVIDQMITVSKTTYITGGSETVSSKVFLLSTTEVGLGNVNNIAEGSIYEYFNVSTTAKSRRKGCPSTYCLNNAGGFADNNFGAGYPWYWWLRTPSTAYSNNASICCVSIDGYSNGIYAYGGETGLRFAICLRAS